MDGRDDNCRKLIQVLAIKAPKLKTAEIHTLGPNMAFIGTLGNSALPRSSNFVHRDSSHPCLQNGMCDSLCLVPTFQPPPSGLGRNQSNFDRLAMLLSGYSADSKSIVVPIPVVRTSTRASAPESEIISQSRFDLFDGDIIVEENSTAQRHATKAVPLPVAAPPRAPSVSSQPKRSVFSDGNAQKHLTSILNDTLDRRTALPTSSKGEKRKASSQEPSSSETNKKSTAMFTTEDFVGIERFCRNGGASSAGLVSLQQKIQAARIVSMAVVWDDLSCNHVTTTVKYCTQSTKCDHWNCTCDRQIRADFASRNAIGVVLRLPAEAETVYFLPLKECSGSSAPTVKPGSEMLLPMNCGTTLDERVSCLLALLRDASVQKVLYHAQVALIPLLTLHLSSPVNVQNRQYVCLSTVQYVFDPRLAAYLCDSDIAEGQLELESLFDTYASHREAALTSNNTTSLAERAGTNTIAGSNRIVVSEAARSVAGLGRVARTVHRLKTDLNSLLVLQTTLQGELMRRNLNPIFRDIEMPVACLLASMEQVGAAVEPAYLDHLRTQLTQQLTNTELQIYASVGEANRFNVASPEQVSRVLFEVLALPPPTNSSKKGKHHSTSEEDLLKIRHTHPVVNLILNYRALAKVLSTYVDGMRPFLCKEFSVPTQSTPTGQSVTSDISIPDASLKGGDSGVNAFNVLMNQARDSAADARRVAELQRRGHSVRVHANWQQTIVRTGRLSCTKPNLQNIPNEQNVAGLVINVRSAFKASPG